MTVAREDGAATDETLDIVDGLRLLQRRRGYRFSQEALHLAAFALDAVDASRPARVLDLGCGSGVVALELARRRPAWTVAGLELQPGLAALARRNAALNALPLAVHEGDWRADPLPIPRAAWDLVTCNPPYFRENSGLTSPEPERALARQELAGAVEDAVAAARRLVAPGGAVVVVYPADGLLRLLRAVADAGLSPVRLRFVHHGPAAVASAVLVEARADVRCVARVEPPLVLTDGA